ncbi:MAG TPA: CRISPR-associated RAMP protein Csx7, partial [Chloroflexota bacterium]
VVKGPDGTPFIPGSSIKGVLRFQAERILRSLTGRADLRACDPFDDPCLTDAARRPERGEDERTYAERIWSASCLVCRLFGSAALGSRLLFKDAHLLNGDDLPVVTQVRDGVGIDRDLGAAREGIKYDFEVVVPGARFDVEILAENVEPWELGFFLSVLRLWEEGTLAIGGKVTRGPGWGRLRDLIVWRLERDRLLDYLLGSDVPRVEAGAFVEAFRRHVAEGGESAHAQDAL